GEGEPFGAQGAQLGVCLHIAALSTPKIDGAVTRSPAATGQRTRSRTAAQRRPPSHHPATETECSCASRASAADAGCVPAALGARSRTGSAPRPATPDPRSRPPPPRRQGQRILGRLLEQQAGEQHRLAPVLGVDPL